MPTPFKRRVETAKFAINAVGVNLGSRRLFGVGRLFEFILGRVMLVFSDVQGYEKLFFCYSLYPCSRAVSFVKLNILFTMP